MPPDIYSFVLFYWNLRSLITRTFSLEVIVIYIFVLKIASNIQITSKIIYKTESM